MKYLKIRLCAPLMYFASTSHKSYRTVFPTESHPVISTLAGMLCAALGWSRNNPDAIQLRRSLRAYYAHTSELQGEYHGVYTLMDDQTMTPLRLAIFAPNGAFAANGNKDANGFPCVDGTQDYSRRGITKAVEYIEDGDFTVFLEGDEETLLKWHQAFRDPYYMVSIGKNSCFPTKRIVDPHPGILTKEELPACILPC